MIVCDVARQLIGNDQWPQVLAVTEMTSMLCYPEQRQYKPPAPTVTVDMRALDSHILADIGT